MRLHSTRSPDDVRTFRQAMVANLAADGGLYAPELPRFADWDALLALPWPDLAVELVQRLIGDEFEAATLQAAVRDAFSFPVPLRPIEPDRWCLQLHAGPTLAFKDFGARLLARLLRQHDGDGAVRTILTATSGDTGAAVAQAFWHVPGMRAVVLYPAGRVSSQQERQFATLGGNVQALAVAGSFDDCQALVKACFADAELSLRHCLTSANSINIARILAQLCYYPLAVAQLRQQGETRPPLICVPSGNFGNLCAALYAQALGLPLAGLAAACNANTTVPEYLDGRPYRTRPSVATLSNAMDVGAPSNWERIDHLLGGQAGAQAALRWGWASDAETRAEILRLHQLGHLMDPHAAVASAVLARVQRPGEVGVFLATAHPAKFPEELERLTGRKLVLPPELAHLADRPLQSEPLPVSVAALRAVLDRGAPDCQ